MRSVVSRTLFVTTGMMCLFIIVSCGDEPVTKAQAAKAETLAKMPDEIQIEILRKSDVAEESPKEKVVAPLIVEKMPTATSAAAPLSTVAGAPYAGGAYAPGVGPGPYPGIGGDFGPGFGPGFAGPGPFFDPIGPGPIGFDDDDDDHHHKRSKKCTKKQTDDGDPNIPFPD